MLALSCAGAVAMAQTQAGPDSTATKTPAPSPPASAPAPATQSPSPTTPSTSGEIIDRIVAVVEDEAIFESDVDQAVRQYFFQKGQSSVTPAERDEVFDIEQRESGVSSAQQRGDPAPHKSEQGKQRTVPGAIDSWRAKHGPREIAGHLGQGDLSHPLAGRIGRQIWFASR